MDRSLVLALVFSLTLILELAHAQSPLVMIPKLSYDPTVTQLLSDWKLQQEMTYLDLKSGTKVYGKLALGFDDNNVDFVAAHTTQTEIPRVERMFLGIDKIHAPETYPNGYTNGSYFFVMYEWDVSSGKKVGQIRVGTGNPTDEYAAYASLPKSFAWNVSFTTSYFNQTQAHVVYSAQIPNAYMGQGGSDGKYGFVVSLAVNDQTSDWTSYPPNGDIGWPQTYASLGTQYPIPEFPSGDEALWLLALMVAFGGLAMFRRRVKAVVRSQ